MEFGIFVNGYLPGPGAHDRACEHELLMREARYAVHADRYNWKYAWFGEHHGLTEYSHMSAPEVVIPWVAAQTSRIHLGTGINSLSPRKEHPVRYAERAAMLDHFTERRFEWGTGRGAGSHEVASFNIGDTGSTRAEWDEVAPEIVRMWAQEDYEFHGTSFEVPTPHNVLPKPHGGSHPPIWVACGNPPTFAKAGSLGIGAIAFNFEPIYNLKGRIEAYKEAIAACTNPIGEYVNDNIMMTNGVICLSDRERAREIAKTEGAGYLFSLVGLYHDTMPHPDGSPIWPHSAPIIADDEMLDWAIANGYLLCGTPDEVCEQVGAYQTVGCDQLVFGIKRDGYTHEETLEMIELFGTHVIPEFDKDPVHSTTRYRATATPKYPTFNTEPADITVEQLPSPLLTPDAHA